MCRSGDPLAHVYHPWRLQVVCACATVSGTVETARHGDEGDYDIDLALDPAYAGMADAANTADRTGAAQIPFKISGATIGYRVIVEVTGIQVGRSETCSTSFTPTS